MTEAPEEADSLKQVVVQLPRASARLTPSLTSLNADKLRSSKRRVDAILKRYPDYGKATGEYVAALVEVMATYPDAVQDEISDVRHGVTAKTRFLPTVADIVEIGNELDAKHRSQTRYYTPRREVDTTPYCPQQIPQYFDKYGNRITEREAEERAELHRANVESLRKVNRHLAYCRFLGSGDAIKGSILMVERGESEPPEDFAEGTA